MALRFPLDQCQLLIDQALAAHKEVSKAVSVEEAEDEPELEAATYYIYFIDCFTNS